MELEDFTDNELSEIETEIATAPTGLDMTFEKNKLKRLLQELREHREREELRRQQRFHEIKSFLDGIK